MYVKTLYRKNRRNITRIFENGKPKSIITYVRDYEDGPAQFFSKKGYLKQERFFNRNKTDGLLNEFFQNGNLKSTQYVTNKLIQKYSLIFHQKGGLRTVFNIKDNKQMELLMNIMLKVNLSQNQITSMEYKKGFLRSLDPSGGFSILNYSNNQLNGIAEQYSPNGLLLSVSEFKNGSLVDIKSK